MGIGRLLHPRLGRVVVTTRLAAAAGLVAGLLACTSTDAPGPAERDRDGPTTVTPAQLGEDSFVALVGRPGVASLEVITPDGVRHRLLRRSGDHVTLADWRPELRTALLVVERDDWSRARAVAYDVTSGVIRTVVLPRRVFKVALDPARTGLLVLRYVDGLEPGGFATLAWDGVVRRLPGRSSGAAITSVDGASLLTPGRLVDLATRTSTPVAPSWSCSPVRWLDIDSAVAQCSRGGTSQLRALHLDGRSTPLGALGTHDLDVRVAQGRRWYRVEVPGLGRSSDLVDIVDVRGDDLVVERSPGLYRNGTFRTRPLGLLAVVDPVTGAHTVLTRLRTDGAGRDESWLRVLPATEVWSWG